MASSCVADTSWVYALLDRADEFHLRAVREAEAMEEIHVPAAVLVETLMLVRFRSEQGGTAPRASLRLTRQAVESLSKRPNMRLGTPPYDHEATLRIWAHHETLSFADATVIAAARRLALDLATFDSSQLRAHRSGSP